MTVNQQDGTAVLEPEIITGQKTHLSPKYRVLVHNDDVTPADFVVHVLREVFRKSLPDAAEIMLVAHTTGVALVAVLPLEEAELRVEQAHSMARTQKSPLTFTYEPE